MGKIHTLDYLLTIDETISGMKDFMNNNIRVPNYILKSAIANLETLKDTYGNPKREGIIVSMSVKEWKMFLSMVKEDRKRWLKEEEEKKKKSEPA